ncbi:hypothetical protein L6452_03788 [Arctium lappa]|uniref:Uncharacterized protein n=1 Tax=Arctium lappa TaxID=4217 RepID=A0ACB9FMM2_ARCLA|nr:hypothetical protein L6452_03788 [Arctium lappa]
MSTLRGREMELPTMEMAGGKIHDDYDSSSLSMSSTLSSSDSLTLQKLKNRPHHNHNFEPLKIKEEMEDDKTNEGSGGRDNNRKLESPINKQNSKSAVAKEAIDGSLPLKSNSLKVKPLKGH